LRSIQWLVSKAARKEKHKSIAAKAKAGLVLGNPGPFCLIYADPPWKWGHFGERDQENEQGKRRTPDQHYLLQRHARRCGRCRRGLRKSGPRNPFLHRSGFASKDACLCQPFLALVAMGPRRTHFSLADRLQHVRSLLFHHHAELLLSTFADFKSIGALEFEIAVPDAARRHLP
jgi:hypothetical protein